MARQRGSATMRAQTRSFRASQYALLEFLESRLLLAVDLIPQNVTSNLSSVVAGNTLVINLTMADAGSTAAGATTTRLRLNTSSTTTSPSDVSLGDISTPAIAANSSTPLSMTVTIPAGTAAGTYYVWAVADNGSVLTQSSYSNDYAHSPSFTVTVAGPTMSLSSPNAGAIWQVGTSQTVNWTVSGDTSQISYLSVLLSTNNGSSYSTISSNLSSSTRSFNYTPTSGQVTTSAVIWVRAFNSGGSAIAAAISSGPFTIANPAPTMSLSSPNAGAIWQVGTSQSVNWTVSGDTSQISYLSVLLSTNNGSSYSTISSNLSSSTRSFNYTPTSGQVTTSGVIWVRAFNSVGTVIAAAISNGPFTIAIIQTPAAPDLISPGLATSPGQVISSPTPMFQWQPVPDSDQYGLYISKLQPNGTYSLVFDSTALGITIPAGATQLTLPGGVLVDGGQYRWNMNSHNASGWGSYSSRLYFTYTTSAAPSMPTGVTATATDSTTVHLAWPAVANATFYRIYRSTSAAGPWNQLVYQQSPTQTDDPLLLADMTYYYRVQSSGPGGDSDLSDVIFAHTPSQMLPPTPSGLQITSSSTSGVSLTWAATLLSGNYVLQRSSDGVHFSTIATLDSSQNSYADTTIAMSTSQATYQYRLLSDVGGLLSTATNAISATINAVINTTEAVSETLLNLVSPDYASIPQIYWLDPQQMCLQNTTSPVWDLKTTLPTDAAFWAKPTILLTHGLNDTFSPTDSSKAPYIDDFANSFVNDFGTSAANIFAIDWYGNGSDLGSMPRGISQYLAIKAFEAVPSSVNGVAIGTLLAKEFVQAGLQTNETMLVGHSNGAGLMAAFAIKANAMGKGAVEDLVALDAPTETTSYGAVWSAAAFGAAQHVDNYYMTMLQGGFGAPIHLSDVTNYWLYNSPGDFGGHDEVPLAWGKLTTDSNRNQPWDLSVASLTTQTDSAESFDAASLWTQGSNLRFTLTNTYSQSLLLVATDPVVASLALDYAPEPLGSAALSLLQGVNTALQQAAGGLLNWIVAQAHSPVQGAIDVEIPASAALIGFDLTVTDPGNDDTLLIAIGNTVIGQVDLASQQLAGGRVEIPIADYAGQSVTLNFYMPSSVPSTAQFVIGNPAFELSSQSVPPTVQIAAVDPNPRSTPVDNVGITFSTSVSGFDLSDLALTLNGGSNLLTDAQTLVTTDQIHWTLGNLTDLTTVAGTYVLSLKANGSGIADSAGNALDVDANQTWTVGSIVQQILLQDDFSGTSINPLNWISYRASGQPAGSSVTVADGAVTIGQDQTDNGGFLQSLPITFAPTGLITIQDRVYVHANGTPGAMDVYGGTALRNANDWNWQVGVAHVNVPGYDAFSFGDDGKATPDGFFTGYGGGSNFGQLGSIWDAWFDETITLDPVTSVVTYAVNGGPAISGNLSAPMPQQPLVLIYNSYGWLTGHYEKIDSVSVTQAMVDTFPPTSNPNTWDRNPHAAGPNSIAMTATTASDPNGVQYFFHNVTDSSHDSAWQDSASFTDTGLAANTTYSYQVQTRDKSTNQNTGAYSDPASATTGIMLQEDFSGTSLNPQNWTSYRASGQPAGSSVTVADGAVTIAQDQTDNGGFLQSQPLTFAPTGLITIQDRVYVHANSNPTYGGTSLRDATNGNLLFGVAHVSISGFNAFDFGDNGYAALGDYPGYGGGSNFGQVPAIWDTWFDETMTIDPATNVVTYAVNGGPAITGTLSVPLTRDPLTLVYDSYGWITGQFEKIDSVTVTQASVPMPTVTGVYVASSSWTSSFLNNLVSTNQGDATLGYRLPTGSAAQLADLAWPNLNQLSIQFSENVTLAQAALTLTGLSTTYPSSTFSYNSTTHTATWTFANPLPADAYQLLLPFASVTDADTNPLDGEWTDASSTISGNGTLGGDFNFHLNILPGDMNNSGRVDLSDFDIWFTHLQTSTFDPNLGDLNGSGLVDLSDFDIWFTHLQQTLSSTPLPQLAPGESPGVDSPSPTLQPTLTTAVTPSSPGIAIPAATLSPATTPQADGLQSVASPTIQSRKPKLKTPALILPVSSLVMSHSSLLAPLLPPLTHTTTSRLHRTPPASPKFESLLIQ